jgi:iron(III) transport system ATP-binding protein/sulfate transport system ATP-binding protein/putative spermidine/putrescine transport system ATP-binding protein
MKKTIEINNLSKMYQETTIFKAINLKIEHGEILTVVGPSGTGKTTLLRTIAGLEAATAGEILVDQENITSLSPQKRPIVMMFQEPLLFSHMTVFENVEYGLKVIKAKNRKEIVDEMLNLVDMKKYHSAYPHELSGGQQQRIALARALVTKPRLLLLDEPFASLDPELRNRLRSWVRELLKNQQTSAIFVTHDMEEAMYMGDKVAIVANGRVQQIDTPYNVYNNPKNVVAASFFSEGVMIDENTFAHVNNLRMARVKADNANFSYPAKIKHALHKHGLTFYTLALDEHDEKITIHSELTANLEDEVFLEVITAERLIHFSDSLVKDETG